MFLGATPSRCIYWLVSFTVIAFMASGSQAISARKKMCETICTTTNVLGNIGGCQCSFTLFNKRNSQLHTYVYIKKICVNILCLKLVCIVCLKNKNNNKRYMSRILDSDYSCCKKFRSMMRLLTIWGCNN